jgi:chromosome condensin MukBEF ATPase and DNA-binding subunit MukB
MTKANFVAESYDAFSAMLLVNQGLFLFLPKLSILAEENLANSYNLMEIEQRLNEAGRGEPLLPNETARQASLHVLDDLLQSDDGDYADHFLLSCFYKLIRDDPPFLQRCGS